MLYYNNRIYFFIFFIPLRFIILENLSYYMLSIYLTSLIYHHIFYVYPNKHSEQEINSASFYFFIFFRLLSAVRDHFPPGSTFCFCHWLPLLPRGESRRPNDKSSPREYLTRGNFASVSICACEIRSWLITRHVTRNE